MGCNKSYSCARWLLIIFNFFFLVAGAAMIGLGTWISAETFVGDPQEVEAFQQLYPVAYALIALGALSMVLSILGGCGAREESPCSLTIYALSLVVVIAGLIAAAAYSSKLTGPLEEKTTEVLDKAVTAYDDRLSARTFLDTLQTEFKCCGSSLAAADYALKSRSMRVPDSCAFTSLHRPCTSALIEYFSSQILILRVCTISFTIYLVVLAVMALCMSRVINKRRHAVGDYVI